MPGAHRAHKAVPSAGATLPGKHAMHADELDKPGTGLAVPAGHRRHASLLVELGDGLYVPVVHGLKAWRRESPPASEQKPPGGQAMHAEAPASSEYEPGAHERQLALPSTELNEPGEHAMQLAGAHVPNAGWRVPTGHGDGVTVPSAQ